jgi:hypothetical protein
LFSDPSEVTCFVEDTKLIRLEGFAELPKRAASVTVKLPAAYQKRQGDKWTNRQEPPSKIEEPSQSTSLESQRPGSRDETEIDLLDSDVEKLARARIDHLLSQAVSEQGAKPATRRVRKSTRFRRGVHRAHDWVHEHPPGWGAVVAGIIIPVVIPLNTLFGQGPPPPKPIEQQIVIQESGEPPIPHPEFRDQTVPGSEDDPRLMQTFVTQLSMQQRAELALGKLSDQGAGYFLNALTPEERFGLAVKGLSGQQLPQFKEQVFSEVQILRQDAPDQSSGA